MHAVFLVTVEKTQCWHSRHADIDFLCFQPIARYDFLSDDAEEQLDTHRLSHDARKDALSLLCLALAVVAEKRFDVFPPAFQSFSEAQPLPKKSHIPHSLRRSAIVPRKESVSGGFILI
ncbi:uncharacterized protein ACO6RY_02698 [Pungitius sinensis]